MTAAEFDPIYRAYFGRVYQYLLRLSGNPDLAEELTSDTFFKALHALDRFRGDCDLGTWLCQIGQNCYYSHLRKHKREVPVSLPPEPAGPGLEEQLLSQASAMGIYAIVHRMAEPYKEVFTLRVLGELSFRQIGTLFGKSENWACVTYHRARQKIQREMEEFT